MSKPLRSQRGLLPYIAVFKFIKATLLVVVGIAVFKLVSDDFAGVVEGWLAHLSSPTAREMVEQGLAKVLQLSPGNLKALGVGAWLYALLFVVEGTGLWLERRWAEYLTIVATSSFIPFEFYEMAKEVTTTRVSALVLNVATVIYLVWRVRTTR